MNNTERRYDIDWLRVIAIGMLLIYHVAIIFQPWAVFLGFLQNDNPLNGLWVPMSILNIWRIPLLFFVSGMGVSFAMQKRDVKQLVLERTKRLFVPLLFGAICIVPLHIFIWEKYYAQKMVYQPHVSHLWFLANIFSYVILILPLVAYFKNHDNGKAVTILKKVFNSRWGILLLALPFMVETLIMKPQSYELYALNWHGYFLGFIAFLCGFIIIISGNEFWNTTGKWFPLYLAIAILLYIIRIAYFKLESPGYLMALESVCWIISLFGIAWKYLNLPGKWLRYFSQAAYPVYIVHMLFMFLGSYFILPLQWPTVIKFILILFFTFAGSMIMFELLIKRLSILRLLFGLKSS